MPKALITGITGQDGSYLTELLLGKGYEVHGLVRRTSTLERSRLDHLYRDPETYNQRLFLHYGELSDTTPLRRTLMKVQPDEIYHLAGQSHVGLSFEIPETTCEMTALGTLRLLEMIRDLPKLPRFFHAASSEIFGEPKESPQTETTPVAPVNPYGCAKAYAAQMVDVYRRAFKLFAVNGILFNHESPRRGENFVTRKIARAAAAIKLGQQKNLTLGSMSAKRDWGHARDYVEGMWMALQHDQPETFIFATGKLHSVQDVVEAAFKTVGLNWEDYVQQDQRLMRAMEPIHLVGDASKAKRVLGWEPKTTFAELIAEMTEAELAALQRG
jgi:GDPmannose 4,6-dehydratase